MSVTLIMKCVFLKQLICQSSIEQTSNDSNFHKWISNEVQLTKLHVIVLHYLQHSYETLENDLYWETDRTQNQTNFRMHVYKAQSLFNSLPFAREDINEASEQCIIRNCLLFSSNRHSSKLQSLGHRFLWSSVTSQSLRTWRKSRM